jgi:FkbM family methyltransferase
MNPGDIVIRHHYTGDRVKLHSYRHKGYWFHGRRRERDTMLMFQRLLHPGDTVIEVGGHIGYISLYFQKLVNPGRVFVFEPGPNNLPYIRENLAPTPITLVPKAVGNRSGVERFFVDNLTGQNNTFLPHFDVFERNKEMAFNASASMAETMVEVVTLDAFTATQSIQPTFVKIDVEGFEHEVVDGMRFVLETHRPSIMVEIQANHAAIFELLTNAGYWLCTPQAQPLRDATQLAGNTFCLHSVAHRTLINELQRDFTPAP